jgi:hypothetical protein
VVDVNLSFLGESSAAPSSKSSDARRS